MRTEFFYPSAGQGTIRGFRWEPEGVAPKAVIQIVHGIAEHIERYDALASYFNEQGYLVVAEDHMGHGGSIGKGIPGYFVGGWFKAVQDTYRLLRTTRMENPDIPYFLFGHSMGSFMARTLIAKHPDCGISGVILSGTGWIHRGLVNTCSAACTLVGRRKGFDKADTMLENMAFGTYNSRVEHQRTSKDWISRDHKVVDAYIADPTCGFSPTAGLLRDMMTGLRYIQEPEHIRNMDKHLPVLLISGGDDPVGNYGKGVEKTAQAFRKAGMEDVTVKLYPLCRHELHNEINKEEVCEYLTKWIEEHYA